MSVYQGVWIQSPPHWRMSFTYTLPNRWCRRGFCNCTFCTCRHVATVAINGADLLGLHARKFIHIHNCPRCSGCILLTWRKIWLRNYQWRSRVIYCWNCLVQSWSLQKGGDLRVERIKEVWSQTLEDSSWHTSGSWKEWARVVMTAWNLNTMDALGSHLSEPMNGKSKEPSLQEPFQCLIPVLIFFR